ncbi:hypothetical protein vseg_000481 [Gypsophila vaccaria]
MADDGGEPSTRATAYGGGERSSYGKLRRERKPPSTPYDRPPPHLRRSGWISRLVDPAKRLLSGGATLLLPSLFSPSPPAEELQSEVEQVTEDQNENINVKGIETSSIAVGNLKPETSDKVRVDKTREHSEGRLPDIEQLIKGKTFSRQEVDHLMEVLRSRVVNVETEAKAPCSTEIEGNERAEISKGKQKASIIESGEIDRIQLTSTPLQRPSLQGEIGASPVDIARAYMGSRTSEVGLTSGNLTLNNEKWGLTSEFPSKQIMPSPLPKEPICWPGAVTQNQQGHSTPQNQKTRYGIQSFSRTPYSRTMYTKSKSKLTPLRGDSERLSTPFLAKETPGYGKSISSTAQDSYGSGGPMRRTRNKFTPAAPARESPLGRSIHRSPFAKQFNADNMIKSKFEHGGLVTTTTFEPSKSKGQGSEVSTPNVHPHSSKLARQILEHIDRPVTLKEKSKELKLATSSKNSPAAASTLPVEEINNPGTAGVGARKSVDLFSAKSYSLSNGEIYGFIPDKSDFGQTKKDVASSSKLNPDKISAVSDGNDDSAPYLQKLDSRTRSPEQASENFIFGDRSKGLNINPNSSRHEPQNAQRKPFLTSISVGKSGPSNPFTSDTSAGFSFPVTTSSNTYFDLPTPTVMPSSLTNSPQKPKETATDKKITIAPPVYSLPPTSTTSKLTDEVAPTLQFGSGKARLSFAIDGDDGASVSDNAPSVSYKFGSGKTRLNFGSIASYAVCR